MIKHESLYYEHFYKNLQPYQHFIPFSHDPKVDLVNRVNWLKKHDREAEKIMKNARNFVRDNLTPRNIFCYYLQVFNEFSKRITSPIEVRSDMEEVIGKGEDCEC